MHEAGHEERRGEKEAIVPDLTYVRAGGSWCYVRAAKTDAFLDRHGIIRSLSRPGTPVDNAVSESFYRTVRKEFVRNREFPALGNLELLFGDWVHWYNNCRFHSANGDKTPVAYRLENTAPPFKKTA